MISSTWPMPETQKPSEQEKSNNNVQQDKNDLLSEKVDKFIETQISVQQLKTLVAPNGLYIQAEQTPEFSGLNDHEIAKFSALMIKKLVQNETFIKALNDDKKLKSLQEYVESMSVEELAEKAKTSISQSAAAKSFASITYSAKGKIPFPKYPDDYFPSDDEPF